MKPITPLILGMLAVVTISARSWASANSIDTVIAAQNLAAETHLVKELVHSTERLQSLSFDAERLEQAADRFQNVVGIGMAFFNVERKFQRISQLVLLVRSKLIGSLYGCEDIEVEMAVEALEGAYLDLAAALYSQAPEPVITDGHSR